MNTGTLKLTTIGGIDIKAHWSWLIILFVLTFSLATRQFPAALPNETALSYFSLAFIGSIMLFVSVLIHELSHSLTARAKGYKVREIVLFIFGGVSNIEEEPKKPGDEFLISVVGPASSFVLAGVFYGLALLVHPGSSRVSTGAEAIFGYLAFINVLLGLFNMIPGFPLDGGRVLRAIIWGITRDFRRATRYAAVAGQIVAYGFIAFGLFDTLYNGNFGGLWTAFIGWFLLNAARQSTASPVTREALRRTVVGQVMEPPPPACPPTISLGQLLTQYIFPYNLRAVPVADAGKLVGIITLGDIKEVPQDQWETITVGSIMTGPDKLRVAHPQDNLETAMRLLGQGDFDQLPVVDTHGQLSGILTRARILRWLQEQEEPPKNISDTPTT
jgi:Zn-dependent protease/predicted transcriptional regulator